MPEENFALYKTWVVRRLGRDYEGDGWVSSPNIGGEGE